MQVRSIVINPALDTFSDMQEMFALKVLFFLSYSKMPMKSLIFLSISRATVSEIYLSQ